MPPVGFEPTISAGERPKTYALDRAATGIGSIIIIIIIIIDLKVRAKYFRTLCRCMAEWRLAQLILNLDT